MVGGNARQGVCMVGGVHGEGHVWWGRGCVAGEMANAVGGMHPTGMHSCFHYFKV